MSTQDKEYAAQQTKQHPDDTAVDALAAAMKAKLAKQRAKGYGGWDTDCTQQRLSDLLRGHVDKGDPVDVANFCAFLLARGEGIAAAQQGVQPVAGQSRMFGGEWGSCSVEHVAMVLAAPHEWKDYEARYLYTNPTTQGLDAQQLHSDIMNMQAGKHMGLSYREGHRDARHAAAELVLAAHAKQGGEA